MMYLQGKKEEGGFNSYSSQKSINQHKSLRCKLCGIGLGQHILEYVIQIVSFLHSCVYPIAGWKTLVKQTH